MKITKLTDEKHLNMVAVDYKDSEGKPQRWVYATRNKVEDLPITRVNAVFIAATVNGKLCIIKEFRAPLNAYQYSVPAGLVEVGETIEQAIERELREETGLDFESVAYLSPPLASSPGLTDEVVQIALVKATGTLSKKGLEDGEDIEAEMADYSRVQEIFTGKEIVAAPALMAYTMYMSDQEALMGDKV